MSPFAQFACDNGLNVRGEYSLEGPKLWGRMCRCVSSLSKVGRVRRPSGLTLTDERAMVPEALYSITALLTQGHVPSNSMLCLLSG